MSDITQLIKNNTRIIPDYPRPGIQFQDITPLLANALAFKDTIEALAQKCIDEKIDKVAAIEARGFILGSALALRLGVGFIPIRKKGKLPAEPISTTYSLEYGVDIIEIHKDAASKGENILLIDDIIASGGTAIAAAKLLKQLGVNIVGACFITNLSFLGGAEQLKQLGIKIYSLLTLL